MATQEELRIKVGEGKFSQDMVSEGLPLITEAAYGRLMKTLRIPLNKTSPTGFNNEPITYFYDRGAQVVTDESTIPPVASYNRAMQMASDYFDFFCKGPEGGILYQTERWLEKIVGNNPPPITDALSVGMAVVIAAYHTQCGAEFLDRLRDAPPQDVMKAFDGVIIRGSIIARVRSNSKIPESEVFLNACLNQFVLQHVPFPLEQPVEDGASAMYQVISKLWPHLATPLKEKT